MMALTVDLPVVNLSEERLANDEDRKEETDKLLECFSTVGFCLIEGIEDYDEEKLLK